MLPRAIVLLLTVAGLSSMPAALADHPACAPNDHVMDPVVLGSVRPGHDNWWLLRVPVASAIVLTPQDGDVDLQVMDVGCTVTWCTSTHLATVPDWCLVNPGTYRVRVYHYLGVLADVDYVLKAVTNGNHTVASP